MVPPSCQPVPKSGGKDVGLLPQGPVGAALRVDGVSEGDRVAGDLPDLGLLGLAEDGALAFAPDDVAVGADLPRQEEGALGRLAAPGGAAEHGHPRGLDGFDGLGLSHDQENVEVPVVIHERQLRAGLGVEDPGDARPLIGLPVETHGRRAFRALNGRDCRGGRGGRGERGGEQQDGGGICGAGRKSIMSEFYHMGRGKETRPASGKRWDGLCVACGREFR